MSETDTKSTSTQDRPIGRERIACLKRIVSQRLLEQEIGKRKLDKRACPKCPSRVIVWFIIAMWLYGDDSYCQVFRWLHRFSPRFTPSSSALTQARAKVGVPILAYTYRCVVECLCSEKIPDSFYAGRRLVAVDGFVLNLPDSEANRRAFGRPTNGTSVGAFPQVRIVALCEVGSHVFFNFLAKPIRCGEATMAQHVYKGLPEKSLLLFDIGFCSSKLMKQVIDQNSDFLGRAKANRCFEKMEVLSDGSYLSKIYEGDYDRLHDRNGTVVRVIEYTIDDPERVGNGEVHRLVTTLLDAQEHPAEVLIVEAAIKAGVSPRRISFTGTLNVLRARLPEAPRSRHLIASWYNLLVEEISLEMRELRRNRINPRVIKRPQSKWPKKQEEHRNLPPLKLNFKETICVLT